MLVDDKPIVVEQEFTAPIGRLWQAITVMSEMQQWFFEQMENFEPVEGFETKFTIEFDGKEYAHVWKLIEVVPRKKIVFDWSYAGCPGRGHVTWEIEETPGGSKLKLTNVAVESFPQDDPAFLRESGEEGWKYLIQEELKHFVEA
ncbi:MAG: SRPBCC domain-containing protein [Mariniblastus sp.]